MKRDCKAPKKQPDQKDKSTGDVQVRLPNGTELKLKQVRHVPNLTKNLISVSQLSDEGCITMFGSDQWKLSKGTIVVARGKREGTLYVTTSRNSFNMATSKVDANMWNQRLRHMSVKGMKVITSKGKHDDLTSVDLQFCESCVF